MTTRHSFVVTSLIVLFLLHGTLALAQMHMMGKGMMSGKGGATAATPASMDKGTEEMQRMQSDFDAKAKPLSRQLTARQLELNAALLADVPDQNKVNALTDEINKINGELYKLHVSMQMDLASKGMHDKMMQPGMGMMGTCPMMQGQGMKGGMGKGMMGGMGMMSGQESSGYSEDAKDQQPGQPHQ